MTIAQAAGTLSVRSFFAGKDILVTGSTGFLAKAIVEKILRVLPEAGRVFLLIRPRSKPDGSLVDPEQRLREEILRNSAFGRLRAQMGGRFEAYCRERIVCVPGDLTHERLGQDEAAWRELARSVKVVINSAATVVFDERLDLALEMNTLSPLRLLDLAREAGATYVHISTAYVCGRRRGVAPERLLEPLEAIDAQLPLGQERPAKFDLLKEIERLKTLCKIVIADGETQARKNGWAPASEEARTSLARALVSAGMTRARTLGWNDTYTYTKFLGEHLVRLKHGEVPTAIVRPSIIESSLREPEPGWLDGLRMADPIIIGFGKGRLADFPAGREVVMDLIPADLVVNAVLAAGAHAGGRLGAFDLFHVASSTENPLAFEYLYQAVRDYFQKHPMLDRAGRPVRVPHWKFPTVERFRRNVTYRYLHPLKVAQTLVDGPLQMPGTRRLRTRLRSLNTAMEQLLYYVDIYSPYTNLDCRFETTKARELLERLDPAEREAFDFDPRRIRWRHYIQDVHIPGLKRNILRMELPPRAGAGQGQLLEDEAERGQARAAPAIHGVPQTLDELAARGADLFGAKPFLELRRAGGETTSVSYAGFFERAGTLARKLRAKLGLQPGDRVALSAENSPEWCLAYLAVARAGGAAVPLDKQLAPGEAARLVREVEACAWILSPSVLAAAAGELGPGKGLPVRLDPLHELEPHAGDAWPSPAGDLAAHPPLVASPESLASILFTSGTTYAPKGVLLTHGNFVANALGVAEVLEPLESDCFLSVLPLHHAFEFTGGFLAPLFGGATVHHLETLREKEISETMRQAGVTVMLGVPRLFQRFAAKIRATLQEAGAPARAAAALMGPMASAAELLGGETARRRIFTRVHEGFGGKLRLFVSGGAALPAELFHFFRHFGITIVEGYGLTETAPILAVNPLAAPKPGSVGLPIPGAELRVRDPDLQGVGVILARGPMVMHGYWRDPEATEQVFEEGWFRTGDLGRFDSGGYLYLTGRVDDVVVTAAGKKVYPDEIEQRFRGLPGARECCVLGLPARSGHGEEVALVAVPEKDGAPTRTAIRAAIEKVNQGLPAPQRVARVEFRADELPKTATFKVQRAKLREHFAGAARPSLPALDRRPREPAGDELFREVARAVAEVAGVPEADITPEKKLQLDLGIDSIGRVDLVGKLEMRLNIALPEEALAGLWTVDDAVSAIRAVREAGPAPAGKARGAALAERVFRPGAHGFDASQAMAPSLSKTVLQGALKSTEKVFFNAYLSIEAKGLEHLPAGGAYILASNHSSHLDTAAIRSVLGERASRLHVMGAKDYFFDTRLRSWFFSTVFNVLPFEREDNTLEGLALCRQVLESGRALLIFPEGTRTITGQLQSFKSGIGILALELDFPVIPTHIQGTYEALPKGRSMPRPSHVEVRFGPAVDFGALKRSKGAAPPAAEGKKTRRGNSSARGLYREAAEQIRAAVARLAEGR